MFTEGLDGNALKWVRQKGGAKKDIFSSIPIQRSKPDGITNLSNGSQGTGMPFSSGLDPVKMIHLSGNDSGSGSDMDISPDSDDEVFVGQHSVKYSPQDDNISNGVAPKYGKPLHKQVKHDNDRNQQKQGNGGGRHATAKVGFSDSATSIEVSFTQFGKHSKIPKMPSAGAHILVYPFPTPGHIIPLLDVTHRLLSRGLNVTVLVTPNNSSLLDTLTSSHPSSSSLQTLILPAPSWSTSSTNRLVGVIRGLQELHYPELLAWFKSHPSPPVAILSDFFLGWTRKLASEVGVPRVVFSPSGALALSVAYSMWTDLPKNEDPNNLNFQVPFPKIPNCPTYPWFQIHRIYREGGEGDPDWELYRSCFLQNKASWGVVFNSAAELERDYIDHIKKDAGHDRVWAVGPVLPPDDDSVGSTSRGGSTAVPSQDVLKWLDSRQDDSVVYVCFGSRQVLNSKQTEVLAAGLEKSGVNFIWCVREINERNAGSEHGELPDGFEDRVAGRGFIIKGWAPQVAILRHRATGAFLTHCGWNSTLEGISAGVVMLTWPMSADQFTDAQLLVDELGVGIRVGENTERIPDPTKLAQLFAESVDGRGPQRKKAKELKKAVMRAVRKGGSSDRDLDEFVESINKLGK